MSGAGDFFGFFVLILWLLLQLISGREKRGEECQQKRILSMWISENVGIFKNFGPSGDFQPEPSGHTDNEIEIRIKGSSRSANIPDSGLLFNKNQQEIHKIKIVPFRGKWDDRRRSLVETLNLWILNYLW